MSNRLEGLRRWVTLIIWGFVIVLLLQSSTLPPGDIQEQVRFYTRAVEFDYISWTIDALALKIDQSALGTSRYLPTPARKQVVEDYLKLVAQIQQTEGQITQVFANPDETDPQAASTPLRENLQQLEARRQQLAPLAEAVLQAQISAVLGAAGLSLEGQPLPPVLYHSTPLPLALIVSPRQAIRQDANISIQPDLTIPEQEAMESQVDQNLNVSSLVVPVGGIGVYPTMVMQTTDLNWLAEVVAHEWIHNYLTLRPLGVNYLTSPELRTINETVAAIAGKELGSQLIQEYYPERVPPPPPEQTSLPLEPSEPPAFDFRAEMHTTRVTVDALLAEKKIEEAETYMNERQRFFWDQGYLIRKINQAYFAFYGAYADEPGGAAGEDPVGAAVRQLRVQSASLADFLRQAAWITSFEQLKEMVGE